MNSATPMTLDERIACVCLTAAAIVVTAFLVVCGVRAESGAEAVSYLLLAVPCAWGAYVCAHGLADDFRRATGLTNRISS